VYVLKIKRNSLEKLTLTRQNVRPGVRQTSLVGVVSLQASERLSWRETRVNGRTIERSKGARSNTDINLQYQ